MSKANGSTPAGDANPGAAHRRSALGRLGVSFGVVSVLLLLIGPLGARFGLFPQMTGFLLATLGAAAAAVIGLLLGLLALIQAFRAKPRLGLRGPTIAVALCGLLLAVYVGLGMRAAKHPPIHDVATDWRQPLMPTPQLLAARGDKANPIESEPTVPANGRSKAYAGQTVAEINTRTCPSVAPLVIAAPVDVAFTRVRDAVKGAGLEIVTDDPRAGRLEATATSGWFRFKDDLMVRVRPEGAGARVDMRSVSRKGVSDLGVNCQRLTKLRGALGG